MLALGVAIDLAIDNPVIPLSYRERIRTELLQDTNIILEPPRVLVADSRRAEWLRDVERQQWYYWPTLRRFLIERKRWPLSSVRSLDEASDRVLEQLAPPTTDAFDIRGLVLGYVQSGKTANFTALIAKAVDVGYRLIIVLSGVDNGLRRQTQMRLKKELVGYTDNRPNAVPLPPVGHRWHEFTRDDIHGDFQPGYTTPSALQAPQPVLLVVKKNGAVLRRLLAWLSDSGADLLDVVPCLVIDDEADQASVDTRGSYQTEDTTEVVYEEPSVINGLIRDLLSQFKRKAYVAYTATPFANILIPHDTYDPNRQQDLYPKDFIVDLPRPEGYFGAEQLFGRFDATTGTELEGLDIVRNVTDCDLQQLHTGAFPSTLEAALMDFVLAGAARMQRGQGGAPATMLVHTSYLIEGQNRLTTQIQQHFGELRDEWRYDRSRHIRPFLDERWTTEFRPITRSKYHDRDVPFKDIEPHIGQFFESVQVFAVNSDTGSVLDYEREPSLKAIAVGGNKLSRGVTLEGLTVSYFVRSSAMYDTLMQMGRWFGFRSGYDDLTRIYTTPELAGWFQDLARVEHELREDIRIYEAENINPRDVGTRILNHPAMLVTSPLKKRFATTITVSQSYAGQVVQTFKFPLQRLSDLGPLLQHNYKATASFLQTFDRYDEWQRGGPIWRSVNVEAVIKFLADYTLDERVSSISLPLVRSYLQRQTEVGELINWTVAVRGRKTRDPALGSVTWDVLDRPVFQLARSRRLADPDSIGVLTEPGDELIGLSDDAVAEAQSLQATMGVGINPAARHVRNPTDGLLLIYPISRHSGQSRNSETRRPLFENMSDPNIGDIIGIALSFPYSENAQQVFGQYTVGTPGWRPME